MPSRSLTPPAETAQAEAGRLRLLFALPFSPRLDAMHGGRVVAQLLLRLAERHDIAVLYLTRPDSERIQPELAERCRFVEEVELPHPSWSGHKWRSRLRVLQGLLTGMPNQASAVRTRRFGRALRSAVRRWEPQLIQLDHDELAQYARWLRSVATPAVLVSHDPDPARSDFGRTTRVREGRARKLDAHSWRRYRRRFLRRFDAVVAFTEQDRRVLLADAPRLHVACIPMGIDFPAEPLDPLGAAEPSIVFVGGYRHPPNADAALLLLRSIAPLARRAVPELRLLLVGDSPTAEMRAEARSLDTVTGTVSSVTPWLNQASLVVLPLRLGGGMRVKLLEALASGKAVIASQTAAAGLDVADGRQLVLADTDQEFADAIVALLGDDERRGSLGRAAREWSLEHLDWGPRVGAYEQLYCSLVDPATG
jgi:glycosyltransferase involved in cell wall biosynthesis